MSASPSYLFRMKIRKSSYLVYVVDAGNNLYAKYRLHNKPVHRPLIPHISIYVGDFKIH